MKLQGDNRSIFAVKIQLIVTRKATGTEIESVP